MGQPGKVVWHEGMFLAPHHFQQWDQYYGQLLQERLRVVNPFGWGLMAVRLDADDLANNIVRILALRGVLPDGMVISVAAGEENGSLLEPRPIDRYFPPSLDHLDVFVGIPAERTDGPNCLLDETGGRAPTRYVAVRASVADLNSGEKREILLARANLRILFSGEDAAGFITLKVLELERASGGGLVLRDKYLPPCLTIGASPWLMRLLRSLLELLSAKRKALVAQQLAASPGGMDQARCSRLHILNAHLPVVAHYIQTGHAHPEGLYLVLARLLGELSTVYPMLDPMEVPPYDHFNLYSVFREMDARIRQALKEEETRTESIPLTQRTEFIWEGAVADELLLQSGHLYLVVAGGVTDEQLPKFVKQIRIAAPDEVESIVSGAVEGLGVTHVAAPPPTMAVKAGYRYFRLEEQGPRWAAICRARALAVYVPPALKEAKLELIWTR